MSTVVRRYFWCDAPSPLHEAKENADSRDAAASEKAMKLAVEVGAETYACSQRGFLGFIFAGGSPSDDHAMSWKKKGYVSTGEAYYMPQRNTKAGRLLFEKLGSIGLVSVANEVLRAADLLIMTFAEPYMHSSTAGWKDDRIFVSIPQGGCGDPFPKIPDYLTECEKWEMERWFSVGRKRAEVLP